MAIYQYTTENISLARAANLAGVSWAQMLDILRKNGVQPFLGPDTVAEAEEEVASLRLPGSTAGMSIIVNTTVISTLAAIGQLDLLRRA